MRLADDKVLLATDEPVIEVIATVSGISPSSARPGRCRRYSRRVAVRRPDRTRADRVAAATYPTPQSSPTNPCREGRGLSTGQPSKPIPLRCGRIGATRRLRRWCRPGWKGAARGQDPVRAVRPDEARQLPGHEGHCPRYLCARARQPYSGEQSCQSIGRRRLEGGVFAEPSQPTWQPVPAERRPPFVGFQRGDLLTY